MHAAALHLAPILGAEKSKTPFYVAGGALVAWALILSLVLGLNRPRFPGDLLGQRAVIVISAILVIATLATAVVTASPPAKARGQAPSAGSTSASSPPSAPSAGVAPSTASTSSGAAPSAPAGGRARTTLKLSANPTGLLSYDSKQLRARAGTTIIALTNLSPVEHNVTVAQGARVLGATPTFTSATRTLTLTLKRGSYTFYCSVPGHRQAGMEGTLNVS
jgi:plastocyanin